ncbi:hypothetical protein CFP65_3733 [Kitasatospora sp. MMS16-BH015]|uniref:TetR/AcrR family transcriptional regulator n=1 Tax=Kitasatospora sp. MMS16-BH015 TaxID=2018025 RepID=UPI000CA2D542|nr:TetR/AcrR family transcriptional regulator [Kitasatospora sp. MMS16-BH015]AUG78519.1 hypothetical protein CFP65_3733 [Kitasatospora sp. MMS16-BH015]
MSERQAESPTDRPPRRGLAEKRQAIVQGAGVVFAQDGYTRASIDAIAREAGVSTRTIYNHFADKAQLFRIVIEESATRVRDAQLAEIERHLGKVVSLEDDLVGLGLALAARSESFEAHFALVRQIQAEARHLPAELVAAWQEVGPWAVQRELVARFTGLVERGLLGAGAGAGTAVDAAGAGAVDRMVAHFLALATAEVEARSMWGTVAVPAEEAEGLVRAGVRAFLRAYG